MLAVPMDSLHAEGQCLGLRGQLRGDLQLAEAAAGRREFRGEGGGGGGGGKRRSFQLAATVSCGRRRL